MRRERLRFAGALAATVAALPSPAAAHLDATGLGPVYDGIAHFLTSPEDLLPALALALWAGARGAAHGRRALLVLPGAWLLGSLLGMSAAATAGSAVVSALWLLALGALLAADLALSLRVAGAIAFALGLQRGYLNGSGTPAGLDGLIALLGLCTAVFVLVAYGAALLVRLRATWARVAVRVAGSWIAASGLLLLGWALRG